MYTEVFQIYQKFSMLPFPFLPPFLPLLLLQQSLRLPFLVTRPRCSSLHGNISRLCLCSVLSQSELVRVHFIYLLTRRLHWDFSFIYLNFLEKPCKFSYICVFQVILVPFDRENSGLQLSLSASPAISSVSWVLFISFFSPWAIIWCPGNYIGAVSGLLWELHWGS